jgi:ABC-type amino acid transport system permease subunit
MPREQLELVEKMRQIQVSWKQGDQIGRIFTWWAIVNLGGTYVEKFRNRPNFWATFFYGKSYINFDKKDDILQTHLASLVEKHIVLRSGFF